MSRIYTRSKYRDEIKIGRLEATYSADGSRVLRYSIDFVHKGLNLHKLLSAPELFVLQNKVDALIAGWDEKYDKAVRLGLVYSQKAQADQASIDAAESLDNIRKILLTGLEMARPIEWDQLKDHRRFDKQLTLPSTPPPLPTISIPNYVPPQITFWQKLFGKSARIVATAQEEHQALVDDINRRNIEAKNAFLARRHEWEERANIARSEYDRDKQVFATNRQ